VAATVAAGRVWGDEHARLAPEVVDALAGEALFKLVAPREVGGWEASLPEQLETFEQLGASDPNAAWCVSNAGVAGRAAASLDDATRAEVFADPRACYGFSNLSTGVATPCPGGYRLHGRWPVVSGATHCDWVVLGARVTAAGPASPGDTDRSGAAGPPAAGAEEIRWMLVPVEAYTVEETWAEASAMRATGSHTVVVADKFVPEGRAHSWDRPVRSPGPLYRLRFTSVTGTSAAAISLGVLRSALAELADHLAGYRSSLDDAAPRDWPNVQLTVAELVAAHRAAWAGLQVAAADVWAAAEAGEEVPAPARAALFAAADHAVQVSLGGVSRAFVCGTGGVLRRGHPLELALRDVHGMAVNWERLRRMVFDAGSVLLGQPPRFRAM